MTNLKTIIVISKDVVLTSIVDRLLKDSYTIVDFSTIQSSLDYIYSSSPDLMIIDISPDDVFAVTLLNEIKSDPIFGRLPVLAVFDDQFVVYDWDSMLIDDYLRKSCLEVELIATVGLCIHRAERMVEVNPLTRLPGNIAIIKQIQKRLDNNEVFALAYADLDYFKPYNDRYGFSRGDEVLKMIGRLILNTVRQNQAHGSFVGHIGGDDFVFIMDMEYIEKTAGEIIDNFNKIIPTFYDYDDRARGFIESVDREGNKRTFPFIGISIGVAHNRFRKFSHYGEIAEVASEMKKYAKCAGGSCFKIDKRHIESVNQRAL
ncbi:GGDEF domain-containing protein [Dissulfurispira thermophila]|uniref:diguanylate cyclase n=3 Tax=root TaxID=1 RepID=A0A7G1H1H0_9BACT|nr:GGDEF domain-containing protein [Dissulfurispira thermophila]